MVAPKRSSDFHFFNSMGADYLFYVKTIETNAYTFLTLNILAIGRVSCAARPTQLVPEQ